MSVFEGKRSMRFGLMLLLLLGVVVQAQTDLGAISFSILNDADIVHVSKIEFQTAMGEASVTSTISVTQHKTLRLGPGDALERTLFLSNETAQVQQYIVVLILDDYQVEFELDGKRDKSHTIPLDPGAQQRMQIRFPMLEEEGLHNFVLLVFYDVAINESQLSGIFAPYADSLIVGEDAAPQVSVAKPEDTAFSQGQPSQTSLSILPRGLTLSRTEVPDSQQDLLQTPLSIDGGQTFTFHIHVRNGLPRQEEADEFALIILWDGIQVPILSDTSDQVVYFRLPSNGLINIAASLDIPDEPGLHRLDILAIRNPHNLQVGMGSLEVLHNDVNVDVR